MALIKCPECEKEISDRIEACIHCGFPLIQKEKSVGRLILKALKHPREVPAGGVGADIHIFTTNGNKLATIRTGSVITIDVTETISIYASHYSDDKNCRLNNKTKSNVVVVSPGTVTKLQIGFTLTPLTTKIIISPVEFINAE